MTPSKNRSLGSPEFQISKFFDFGDFEPDITDFVKNLWRELTHSKIWILGSENGSSTAIHGQAWASRGWARASTSKFWNFPILGASSQISPILWRIYKGKWHLPKIGVWDPQNSRFPNFSILGISSQISPILWRIYEGNWHTPKSGFWGVRTARARPFTGKHEQAEAEHEQARANFGIFRFWVFRARYHRFCEEFIKENDTFQK